MEKKERLTLIQRILQESSYQELSQFEAVSDISTLSQKERVLIALLFVWRGEQRLIRGEEGVLESFRLAEETAPESAEVFFWQAIAWVKFGSQEGQEYGLNAACQKFRAAIAIDSKSYEGWYGWAIALMRLGVTHREMHYFQEGATKFEQAAQLLPSSEEQQGQFFWDFGRFWLHSAEISGEAVDYSQALAKFAQAQKCGACEPAFWLDYGAAVAQLASLKGDAQMLLSALDYFNEVVRQVKTSFEGWFAFGRTLKRLYELSGVDAYFTRAERCLAKACDLRPESLSCRLELAELLWRAGQWRREGRDFAKALEVLKGVSSEEQTGAEVLNLTIRILMEQAAMAQQLEPLHVAQQRIREAIERYPDLPIFYCRNGELLNLFGHYFEDESFYQKAKDQFAKSLSMDSGFLDSHFGIGSTYFFLGSSLEDVSILERALAHFSRIGDGYSFAAESWNRWGCVLTKIAQLEGRAEAAQEALEKYGKALAFRGGPDGHPEVDWIFNLGCTFLLLGQLRQDEENLRQAVQILARVVAMRPEDLLVRLRLACAWYQLGEAVGDLEYYEKSIAHFQTMAAQQPEEEEVWDEWGCVLLSLADMIDDPMHRLQASCLRIEAETKFLRAIELGGNEAIYHLSWLYTQTGQYETATQCLRRAAKVGSLPPLEELLHDEWLTELRETEAFRNFFDEASNQ